MTFKEEIELQKKDNKIVTYELYSLLKDKFYWSGRPKEIGDTILFGIIEQENGSIRIITFHEDEVGVIYEEDSKMYEAEKTDKLPRLKKIKDGN